MPVSDYISKLNLDGTVRQVKDKNAATLDMIATIEPTNVASKQYKKGNKFIYNGILYIANQVINAGGTIQPEVNCSPSNPITDYITYSSYWLSDYFTPASSQYSITAISNQIFVYGHTVTISAYIGQVKTESSDEITIGTLSKYYPSGCDVFTMGSIGTSTKIQVPTRVKIATNGDIKISSEVAAFNSLAFMATYSTANI